MLEMPIALALGLRLLRTLRLARTVEGDRLANERLEGGLVDSFSFVDVDRAACVPVQTRVEETDRIFQRRALGEGKLHDRSEEHTSELQSHHDLVCRLLLEKKKKKNISIN